ncbi:MAG: helix-turn-helix domain-containing protein [bacterium]
MTENQRLREFRKKLGYTQKDFSIKLGLKQGSYSDVERGKVGVSGVLLKNLIKKFRINPIWLYEGLGDMLVNESGNYISGMVDAKKGKKKLEDNERTREKSMHLESLVEAQYLTIQTQKELIHSLREQILTLKGQ